ncbi:MAG TPA: hypothetical protein VN541_09675 [Tepidisphaeraceae bacterium]|nr:hypothetical protein [Tepidisphaeraceae bacterium]
MHFDRTVRSVVGRKLLECIPGCDHKVLVIAVTKVHAHLLVELPDNIFSIRAIIGQAKRRASQSVERHLPGQIWARGGTFKPVKSRAHQRSAYEYILYDQGRSAWTWSFRDGSDIGQFARVRH